MTGTAKLDHTARVSFWRLGWERNQLGLHGVEIVSVVGFHQRKVDPCHGSRGLVEALRLYRYLLAEHA